MGEIIAGLLIGPSLLGVVQLSDTISVFAEIGVILLMFSTGLGTNLKQLMKAGPIATWLPAWVFLFLGGRYAAVWCVLWSGCYRQSGIL